MKDLTSTSRKFSPYVLQWFTTVKHVCYMICGIISIVILVAWLLPVMGAILPNGWALMKANTALCVLFYSLGLFLTRPVNSRLYRRTGFVLSVLALCVSGLTLYEHGSNRTIFIDTLLATDSESDLPGRMSLQTSIFLVLFGFSLFAHNLHRRLFDIISDSLSIAVIALIAIILAGYIFNASALFGQSQYTLTSPHTLVCMIALVFISVVRKINAGVFSLLVGIGIGSHIARLTLLWALLLPFVFIAAGAYSVTENLLSIPYAASYTAVMISIVLFTVVLLMAHKINLLELDLRDLSMTDELTKIHNLRGFYLIGEHMYHEGKRHGMNLNILYFDLDGLKRVNDTLGHDVGSQLIRDFANLLRENFRHSDVIARLGGDEFAVLSKQSDLKVALKRFDEATAAINETCNKPYVIGYSVGEVTGDPAEEESFSELVEKADRAMYQNKQLRKRKLIHEELSFSI